ncbi:hypothetical protein Ocin01_14038 [Orchesella cincta]|uniref:EGF-like domain-containing protein n=1 Tax=Orchesella cincta TaxID=48709 RepID=A0A1D2MI94_ORCCI|nr:hypothetical protein Ocin01_14038 [Orchesella cincta]
MQIITATMISRPHEKAFLLSGLLTLLLTCLTSEVGGDSTSKWNDGSNVNGDSSLCRVVRSSKRNLLTTFSQQYTATDPFCNLTNHCTNVTCSADFSRNKMKAGLLLKICEDDPELEYWVNVLKKWDKPWSHTFSAKDGQTQRVEIIGTKQETELEQSHDKTKWFIKVIFSITPRRISINSLTKYLSIDSVLQICQNTSESSCTNTTLLRIPRLPQSQLCDFTDVDSVAAEGSSENYSFSSSRSSRNANAWNPQEFHRQAAERTLKLQQKTGPVPASPGDGCDPEKIFSCGTGSTCDVNSGGSAVCKCLPGYIVNTSSGVCEKNKNPPVTPADDPSSADSINNRSYSSAAGAIISIIILVTIAAGIYFGTKYHYFSRIRHRLPVLRCWPFRRAQSWEDNVTMVNPLGLPEDDDPPLL